MNRSRHRQHGVAFYLLVVAAASAMSLLMLGSAGLGTAARALDDDAQRLLADARAAVLAHLLQADGILNRPDGVTVLAAAPQLGVMRLLPDLPTAAGAGLERGEPVYDGLADSQGCAFRGWAFGMALQPRSVQGAAARCFGRLPWLELGLPLPGFDPSRPDTLGRVPWIIVSPNLVEPQDCSATMPCTPALAPGLLAQPFTGYGVPGQPQYPWIEVRDERGNLLSDRVAVAIVLPGPPLAGQSRNAGSTLADHLDRLTLLADCPQPCRPGVYDNADFNHADDRPWVLIQGPTDPAIAQARGYYGAPYAFNDRIVYLTIDQLVRAIELRARRELIARLRAFKARHGYFPRPASNVAAGACAPGSIQGWLPLTPGTACDATETLGTGSSDPLADWFVQAGWHRYFHYAVSPACVVGTACTAPDLRLEAVSHIEALLFAPGLPITSPPFAASKQAAQRPYGLGGAPSSDLADWLDDPRNVDGDPSFVAPAIAAASNDRPYVVSP
jgi:hypothetical protein